MRAQSGKDPLRVTRDETMMVVVLFAEVMPINNHTIDAVPQSARWKRHRCVIFIRR